MSDALGYITTTALLIGGILSLLWAFLEAVKRRRGE
jgi:hypothetical protein